MADVSQIVLPSGDSYDIKDATARASIPTKANKTNTLVWYGVCSTTASTQAKTCSIEDFEGLVAGNIFIIVFTTAQTYNGAPTLNINNTGAKNICRVDGTNAGRYEWNAGEILTLVYYNNSFIITNSALATTTYYGYTKLYTGATSTSENLALTPASLNSLAQDMISGAPVYSPSATYEVGDRVRYNYKTWTCTTAISTAESWNANHWQALLSLQEQIDANYQILPAAGVAF